MCMHNGRDAWGLLSSPSRCTLYLYVLIFHSFFFSFALPCACGVLQTLKVLVWRCNKLTMTVLERAGSRFASWLSCLFLRPESDNGGQQRQEDGKSQYIYAHSSIPRQITNMDTGVERERDLTINIQPGLVSPMRLASYDNESETGKHPSPLPLSPPPPLPRLRRDKAMSRRSSIRASFSFNRKSTIGPRPSPICISAPSDFRRVQSMTTFPPQPQPKATTHLELSIYNNPHHALPDLPSFDNFHLNEIIDDSESPIKRPQRVFSSPPDFILPPVIPRASAQNTAGSLSGPASFRLPRKPVGTAPKPRRSSTAWPTAKPERQRYSTPASPLIPHFARVQRGQPQPRALSMGVGAALHGDLGFTLQDRMTHDTNNDDTNANMTPPISPSPTLTSPQYQNQHKSLPFSLPPSHPQPQPGPETETHTRSWSGSTLASSTYTCTYNPTSPKGFDVSMISRPGSRTGLGQGAVLYPYPAPTIYEGEQVVGCI